MVKISKDILKVDSAFTTGIIEISIGIAVFSILYRIFRYKNTDELNFDEIILNVIKFIFYSFLAGFIYVTLKKITFQW